EHRAYGNHGDQNLNHRVGAAIKKTLQLVDVVVHGGHQLAGAAGLEKAHVELLGMLIGVLAQVRLQSLGEVAPEDLVEVLEQGFAGPDKKGEYGKDQDLFPGGFEAQRGDEALFLVDYHIDGDTDEDFGGNIEQLVDDRAGGGRDDLAAVASGIAQQPAKGREAAGGFADRVLGHVELRERRKSGKGSGFGWRLKENHYQ